MAALLECFSPEGFPRAVGGPAGMDDAEEEEDDEDKVAGAEAGEGSAVIRSTRVVLEESCPTKVKWVEPNQSKMKSIKHRL